MMKLSQIEKKLISCRLKHNINPGLEFRPVFIQSVENGEEYTIAKLLLYINKLGYVLLLNNIPVNDCTKLASILKNLRIEQKITYMDYIKKNLLQARAISTLEQTGLVRRNTLIKYLSLLKNYTFTLNKI